MRLTRLRLAGFKSFVDSTDLLIEPGLTGIIGPNGCGKSNLLEALRWVQGESSARRLRGEGMDDVIFGGSSARQARNLAEVTLWLDNATRRAPPPWTDAETIEIGRKVVRGGGSEYRVNGRAARARDVQVMLSDAGAGSSSSALVSQGRVGALINAKPAERRLLLEEAAGISGLHGRRAEAEQKLTQADDNLRRVDDILANIDGQRQKLQRQARTAQRYRTLSADIRGLEALVLHDRHREAEALTAQARIIRDEAEAGVQAAMVAVLAAETAEAESRAALPDLRKAETDARSRRDDAQSRRQKAETEAARLRATMAETGRSLARADQDIAHERQQAEDAAAALVRLKTEQETLAAAEADAASRQGGLAGGLAEARTALAAADATLAAATRELATAEAARLALQRQKQAGESRMAQLSAQASEDRGRLAALERQAAELPDVIKAEATLAEARGGMATAREKAQAAEAERRRCEALALAAQDAVRQAETRLGRLKAEADGLRAALAATASRAKQPVLDALTASTGLERALAAGLGEAAHAGLEAGAVRGFVPLPALSSAPFPTGVLALAEAAAGPPVLIRLLDAVGVAPDAAAAERLQPQLLPGQVLVTRDGGVFRWDGYVERPGAPSAAAERLAQRNRLAGLDSETKTLAAALDAEQGRLAETRRQRQSAEAVELSVRTALKQAEQAVQLAERGVGEAKRQAENLAERRVVIAAAADRSAAEQAALTESIAGFAAQLAALAPETALKERVTEAGTAQTIARQSESGIRAEHESLARESETRRRRLDAIAHERDGWQARAARADARAFDLTERRARDEALIAELVGQPEARDADAAEAENLQHLAERSIAAAADAARIAERAADAAAAGRLDAERRLGAARSGRATAEAELKHAESAAERLLAEITERFDSAPAGLPAIAGLGPDEPPPPRAELADRLARRSRERDGLGAVNLAAEEELSTLDAQFDDLVIEKSDLTEAIARLRQGIAAINAEARERLRTAFSAVDERFQLLFSRLFGGGEAELKLIEGDDPLAAGLDIYASPPGKKMQSLTLMSGGEQALTALALLFAVFLVNPSPVCVLDEVDAPLDEANVVRVCDLLVELAANGTRFLIVTHNRMTMARMDRLYGVTMAERGVSQLVSVDLAAAEALRGAA